MRSRRRRRAAPFVATSHGADLYALRSRFFAMLNRFVMRRAVAITVVSEAMAGQMAALGAGSTPIHVQPMGVDLAVRFHPDAAVERDPDALLFVGRFVEKKGLRELIEALPAVLRARPGAHLTVVGFGPEDADRRDQVRALGLTERVRFAGAVPQDGLPAIYTRASVLVVPFIEAASGDQEGLGLVMLEAAGCGCRVVAGALPAVRDVADGVLVRAVPIGSRELLANAVVAAMDERDAERAKFARRNLVARFDWSVVAEGYASLLQRAKTSA
jgi:glycosyltransferase involved in cell wall biosynthesis